MSGGQDTRVAAGATAHHVVAERSLTELRRLGVAEGDLIMVHASLRAIGRVTGGADAVIDALEAAVGTSGTLLMNLGARDDWAWVNERPEEERPALLQDAVAFDHLVTPADPDVGVLAEIFRRRPGTVVNDHPDGRFGARGPLAGALLSNTPWNDYYGPGSVLERLVGSSGKVLRLGADLDTVTVLHYAEYVVPLEHKRRVRRHHLLSTAHGRGRVSTVDCLDDTNGIVNHHGEDYFATILREYLAMGRASFGLVGEATSELIDAADLVEFAVRWMRGHFAESSIE